jgi:NAD(P) transhydrogenase subunit beta
MNAEMNLNRRCSIWSQASCSSCRCAGCRARRPSRQGNFFGMIGMAIAVATTLAAHPPADAPRLDPRDRRHRHRRRHRRGDRAPRADDLDARTGRGVPLARRHGGGAGRRRRVLCACGVRHRHAGNIHAASLVEMSLGVAIGALTFTGSVIAFLKLSGRMSGAPIILPARHIINIVLGGWR